MKELRVLFVVVAACLAASIGHSFGQSGTFAGFPCIGAIGTPYYCPGTLIYGLRGNTSSGTLSPTYVTVAGYAANADGGGGNFTKMGTTSSSCHAYASVSGNGTVGHTQITSISGVSTNIMVGELVTGSGGSGTIQVPPGAEIASFTSSGGYVTAITLTLPLTGTATGSPMITFSLTSDNNGTLIVDSASQCWRKTNYHGDPHEFGAVGDGSTNDTSAIQDWLGGGGPWDATVASNAVSSTGATIYQVNSTIYCFPGINIRTPAIDATSGNAPVTIQAVPTASGGSWMLPAPWPASTYYALMVMESGCRISGLSLDANNNTSVQLNTVFIDTGALRPIIDSHSTILNGSFHNLYCPYAISTVSGLPLAEGDGVRISDTVFSQSIDNNVEFDHCDNVKMNNDLVAGSGAVGIVFTAFADFNLLGSTIQQSQRAGLLITNTVPGTSTVLGTPDLGSIVGNFFDSKGKSPVTGGAGIEFDGAAHFSVCGNHFNRNDNGSVPGYSSAHVRFGPAGSTGATSNAISFCGNDYRVAQQGGMGSPYVPQYVYDVVGTNTTVTNTTLYENPIAQNSGVFSPNAAAAIAVLPQQQVLPGFPANHITGLTLSNVSLTPTAVFIAQGEAADSTNSIMMTLPPAGCTVNLGAAPGPGGLDTGTETATTTYFYFVIAGANVATSCIASTSTTPSFAHASGYTNFRLVGALYTSTGTTPPVVSFVQSDDTFTLASSVAFSVPGGNIGTTSTPIDIGSVPSGISVKAFGRCVGGAAIFLSSGNITAQTPSSSFGTAPAYMVNIATPDTSYPFSLYTVGAAGPAPGGFINAAAVASMTSIACFNDGWIWHRGR